MIARFQCTLVHSKYALTTFRGGVWRLRSLYSIFSINNYTTTLDKTMTENSRSNSQKLLTKIVSCPLLKEQHLCHAFLPCVFSTHKIVCIYSCNDHTNEAFRYCVLVCVLWDDEHVWKYSCIGHTQMAFHHYALACEFWDCEPMTKNNCIGHKHRVYHHYVLACEFWYAEPLS